MKVVCRKELTGKTMRLLWTGIREKDYQIKMMEQNDIAGLLPVSMAGDEKETWISFRAGGRRTLKACLTEMEADRQTGERIVNAILNEVRVLESYMLSPGRLILDVEMIFVEGEKCFFCYDPFGKDDFMARFRAFARDLFRLSKPGEEAFFIRLQKLLLDQTTTLLDLKRLCGAPEIGVKEEEICMIQEFEEEIPEAEDIREEIAPPEMEKKLSFETETIPEAILNFDDDMSEEKSFLSRVAEKGIRFFREPIGKK